MKPRARRGRRVGWLLLAGLIGLSVVGLRGQTAAPRGLPARPVPTLSLPIPAGPSEPVVRVERAPLDGMPILVSEDIWSMPVMEPGPVEPMPMMGAMVR